MVTVVAFTIAVIVAGEINHLNHLLGGAKICPTEGRSSSSSSSLSSLESKISPSSQSSAAQAVGNGWPIAGGA
jgi:hypothetical protein